MVALLSRLQFVASCFPSGGSGCTLRGERCGRSSGSPMARSSSPKRCAQHCSGGRLSCAASITP
eukprot:20356-Prymnesium_polylepis.1